VETSLQKHNLLPEKQKCFLSDSETFHVSQVRFLLRKHYFQVFAHSWKHWQETLAGNNVSATMFPSLPGLSYISSDGEKILMFIIDQLTNGLTTW
jgi:hypothetical protein